MEMTDKQSPWRNPWVQGWFGLLAVFLAVNLTMVYLAVKHRPGLVVDNYYERGQDYEKHMLERQARDPGWTMKLNTPKYVDVAKPAGFGIHITDKQGRPVTPDAVIFYVYRPSDKDLDFSVPMSEQSPGLYVADVSFPVLGVWDILVSAKVGKDEYNVPYRVNAGVK